MQLKLACPAGFPVPQVNSCGRTTALSAISSSNGVFYADINNSLTNDQYFAARVILTPKNKDVDVINKLLLEYMPGRKIFYFSRDQLCDPQFRMRVPVELLNSVEYGSLPLHELVLRIGAPIVLLRNLNLAAGFETGPNAGGIPRSPSRQIGFRYGHKQSVSNNSFRVFDMESSGNEENEGSEYQSRELTPSSSSSIDVNQNVTKQYLVHDGKTYQYKPKKNSIRWMVNDDGVSQAFF
ncbi:hypothetical protein [Parasitella parasitica]|uniref:DNA helicase Pif1-like 2B domain-containing protein n=1 Tax=Parasitella parasitica TaxID=35722 RepID=A0A0B7NPW1_9FUNG|nr:hypothetical protein [Parasitella parasitica]